jgi:diguanylate cyclase (GGDEF)-like protein/PAS domain S-box-containing protein
MQIFLYKTARRRIANIGTIIFILCYTAKRDHHGKTHRLSPFVSSRFEDSLSWIFSPYSGFLFATAAICISVGFMTFRRRNTAGVGTLSFLMIAVAEWALASGFETAAVGIQNKLLWSKIEYLGSLSAPVLFLVFTLKYSQKNRWLKPFYLVLLSIIPFSGFIVASSNDLHNLIWTSYTPLQNQPNILIYGHGIGYYVLLVYDYLIISIGIFTLLEVWLQSNQPARRQVGMLLLGSVFPFLGGIVNTFLPDLLPGVNLTPITFSLTGLVMAFGMFRFRLFDLTPLARDVLIENMDEGILVLDAQNRVVDINPVAQKILSANASENLGQPISKVLHFWPGLAKRLHNNEEKGETEVRWGTNPPRYFHLSVSPLYGQKKQLAGRLIVLRDVTKRHQTEAELSHTIKELGIINHISLAVTSGLDMEHVLKTLHEQCSLLVPIDIFYVALYDEMNSLIQVPFYYEGGINQPGPSRDINDRPGTIGAVIKSRKTLYLNDITNPEILADTRPNQQPASNQEKPARAYIGIPLTVRERVIGVLSIQNYRPDAYTDAHIRILERISVQAAIAIENARLYAEIQRLTIIDELTGLYNFRGLLELGAREVERAQRFSRPLSILFFDIDNFRNFNNTYNHSTGNIILKAVAERWRSILRTVDVLARYGGDEFVALLPETDIAAAEVVARRMVEEIAGKKISTSFGELGVTISIGVTALTEAHPHLTAMIDHANQAEHKAKQRKKGIVVVAQ